jgi:Fe-S cluster assembly protein SufD
MYKHILTDSSTAIFNGKIFVRKDAQKTNAYQSNRTLLLSPTSTINTKPQLEIFADDVKCSHGATTGSVDEEALNYLRSRGISRDVAMNLLTEAFIGEVIQKIELDSLRSHYEGSTLLANKE